MTCHRNASAAATTRLSWMRVARDPSPILHARMVEPNPTSVSSAIAMGSANRPRSHSGAPKMASIASICNAVARPTTKRRQSAPMRAGRWRVGGDAKLHRQREQLLDVRFAPHKGRRIPPREASGTLGMPRQRIGRCPNLLIRKVAVHKGAHQRLAKGIVGGVMGYK